MPADIHLHDDAVEITGGPLRVEGGQLIVRDDGDHLLTTLVDDRQGLTVRVGNRTHGRQHHRAGLEVVSEEGTARLSPERLSGVVSIGARRVSGRELSGNELRLGGGEPGEAGGSDGTIEVRDDQGELTLRVDGATGDIVLGSIGSLLERIAELEARLAALESGPGGGPPSDGGDAGGSEAGSGDPGGDGADDDDDGPGGGPGGGQGPGGGGPPGLGGRRPPGRR